MSSEALTSSSTGTLYFGYGSNLSPFQMARRCPSSGTPIAIARLNSWMWIISERGYANLVPIRPAATSYDTDATTSWGVLYNLTPTDEATLDHYEGWSTEKGHEYERGSVNPIVEQRAWKPFEQGTADYNKLYLPVKIEKWLIAEPKAVLGMNESEFESNIVRSLIYISEVHNVLGRIRLSYVRRMARAARECIPLGIPERWVVNMFSQHGIDKDHPDSFGDDITPGPVWQIPPKENWETTRRRYLIDENEEQASKKSDIDKW